MEEELRDKIWQAMGEAALCWDILDSNSVFLTDKAHEIATDLYDYVVELIESLERAE